MRDIYIATEDALSEAVVERLTEETQGRLRVSDRIGKTGAGDLRKRLPELVRLAPAIPVVLLTDLDLKPCAAGLVTEWLHNLSRPETLLLRIAVREVEAWLLADQQAFGTCFRIPPSKLPDDPESLPDPKQILLNLVQRHAPKKLKQDIVVDRGSGPRQGLAYNLRLIDFVRNQWNPERAAASADSLARARRRIGELAAREF